MKRLARPVALLFLCLVAGQVFAHALQPGYLEITSVAGDTWRIFWRKPDVQGRPMPIELALPEVCHPASGPVATSDGLAWVASWVANCTGGLAGQQIRIAGLEKTQTEVLVRYETAGGRALSQRLTPDQTTFIVAAEPQRLDIVRTYLPYGVDHILSGIDHLLFVFALLLLIGDRWRLVGAITAFTVAHSITMAASTLGWVTLPGPPVEAAIALSIMFLASELLQRAPGKSRTSQRYPWIVSLSFGLLHGFGFAGALREIGLPQTDVPLALLSFNLGVEIGQLLFVGAVLLLGFAVRQLWPKLLDSLRSPKSPLAITSSYMIGSVAAFWFVERIAAF